MLALEHVAEARIREAIADGGFERLPGAGRPLVLDDDRGVPAELRAAYRVLKNAGLAPEEVQLRRGIRELEAAAAGHQGAGAAAMAKLALMRACLEARGRRGQGSGLLSPAGGR